MRTGGSSPKCYGPPVQLVASPSRELLTNHWPADRIPPVVGRQLQGLVYRFRGPSARPRARVRSVMVAFSAKEAVMVGGSVSAAATCGGPEQLEQSMLPSVFSDSEAATLTPEAARCRQNVLSLVQSPEPGESQRRLALAARSKLRRGRRLRRTLLMGSWRDSAGLGPAHSSHDR